ncbi:hypothetical protein [Pedobacter suwonensis]|uniref:hypothetical protein n=1 Tax=Pedobacter suwonensis TaxID=332999 RepID=UPI0036851824
MKSIIFSEAELSWLVDLLKERLVFFSSGNIKNKKRHKHTLMALEIVGKGSADLNLELRKVIYSCINGKLSRLFEQINVATPNPDATDSGLNDSYTTIDMGLDVLTKLGYQRLKYHQKYDFSRRYRDLIPA